MKLARIKDIQLAIEPVYANEVQDDSIVLVFLHEALGSIGQWKNFPQSLCDLLKLNGLIYERRGYGNSSHLDEKRTVDYLHRYAFEELPALVDELIAPEKKILLVGHSDGGTIALLYANRYQNKVAGVISMAAHVIVEDETLAGIEPAVKAFEEHKLEGLRKYHGEKTNTLFYAWADTWRLPEFKNWNICEEITKVSCPTLVLQGVNDQYGTAKQVELVKEAIAGIATCELIPNCGHHPHLEQPQKILESSLTWFKKWYL